MNDLRPHLLKNTELRSYAEHLASRNLPVVFTLNHLAILTSVDYKYLHAIVNRAIDPYRSHSIQKNRKKSPRYISIPHDPLLIVQKWINENILKKNSSHPSAMAYSPGSSIVFNAGRHVGSTWLVKTDIKDFFHSIDERRVYRVFKQMGYTDLLSLELARICTRVRHSEMYEVSSTQPPISKHNFKCDKYKFYNTELLGFLPQGAPTSPILSNLVFINTDERLCAIAEKDNYVYSRYADDIVFSGQNFNRAQQSELLKKISQELWRAGFAINQEKTRIIPPGSRKIITGLIVDDSGIYLRRDFKHKVDHIIHACIKFGAKSTSSKLGTRPGRLKKKTRRKSSLCKNG
ncbi:MAG: reverse transcriptase family protein [Pseudobdellovibrionaceae bacterium]